ncbi:hypothetical protein BT96DRAFT_819659 [Gymnopus androsaceus JB14]|uniref:Tc1-like transposase DDE domain-containing protein n=1 Tax=Gymnopus androsaceus JB14 TaxID=1447944 RepID=A0A6A4HT43_9AGAR|nr:hypothetical protein BT96DRAFT_819659 [Gymnopus androsaceus JB14]
MQWLSDQGFDLLPWPPNSPDQNLIENAWFELEKRVNCRARRPNNKAALWEALQEEWRNLPAELLDNLYDSARVVWLLSRLRRASGPSISIILCTTLQFTFDIVHISSIPTQNYTIKNDASVCTLYYLPKS